MSSITLLAIALLATLSVSAQVVEVDRIAGNRIFFTVRNNSKSKMELAVQDDNLVFTKVELWDCGKGVRLISKTLQELEGFAIFDSLFIEPGATRKLSINLENYVPAGVDQNDPIFRRFLKRDGNDWRYGIRICLGSKSSSRLISLDELNNRNSHPAEKAPDRERPPSKKTQVEKRPPSPDDHRTDSFNLVPSTSKIKGGELLSFYILRKPRGEVRLLITSERHTFSDIEFRFVSSKKKSAFFHMDTDVSPTRPSLIKLYSYTIPKNDLGMRIVVHSFSKK